MVWPLFVLARLGKRLLAPPRQSGAKRRAPRPRLQVEELESRTLLARAAALLPALLENAVPLQIVGARHPAARQADSAQVLAVPGPPGQTVPAHVTLTVRGPSSRDEVGLFLVDDVQGHIGTLQPGDPGYAAAALSPARAQVLLSRGAATGSTQTLDLPGGGFFGLYVIAGGSSAALLTHHAHNRLAHKPVALFSLARANPDHLNHLLQLAGNQFGFADLVGGPLHFKDLVLQVQFGTPSPPPPPQPSVVASGGPAPALAADQSVAIYPQWTPPYALYVTEGQTAEASVAVFSVGSGSAGDYTASTNGNPSLTVAVSAAGEEEPVVGMVSATVTGHEEGDYSFGVTVIGPNGTASIDVPVHVSDASLSADATDVTATEGQSFRGVLTHFTDADPNGAAGDYSASIDWGDGTASDGTVGRSSDGFQVSGSHTYSDEGTYPVQVAIQDGADSTTAAGSVSAAASNATASGSATVIDPPVQAGAGVTLQAVEGQPLSGQVVATFLDPAGAESGLGDYTALIDWGDGHSPTPGQVQTGDHGTLTVLGSASYAEEGTYPVTVSLWHAQPNSPASTSDASMSTSSSGSPTVAAPDAAVTGTAVVADATLSVSARPVSAAKGQPFSGTVATFTDAGNPPDAGASYTARIDWGDGSSDTVNVSGPGPINGSHTYGDKGAYPVTVTVQDDGGQSAAASGTASVQDTTLSVSANPVSATEGQSVSGTVASFTGSGNPPGTSASYTASIDWGDDSSSDTVNVSAPGPINGSHTYSEEGTYTITVTVQDDGGASASASGTAVVADASLSVTGLSFTATEGQPLSGQVVARFTDNGRPPDGGADYSTTIDWGDGSTPDTVNLSSPGPIAPGHTYAEEGTYTITVTVQDDGGASASTTATAVVADASLTVTPAPVSATEGQPFRGVVTTLTASGRPPDAGADYTTTIDWGDGSSPDTFDLGSPGPIAPGHTYAEEGTYTITVTVQDDGGASASATGTAVVADASLVVTAAPVSATEGQPFSGTLATLTDNGNPPDAGADYTATIDWGDSSSPETFHLGSPGAIAPGHTYVEEGTYTFTVTVQDDGGASATATGTAVVADAPLTVTGLSLTATEGQAPVSGTLATFSDADPAGTLSDYVATIDWRDGSPATTGSIEAAGDGTFRVLGQHAYADEGAFPVAVTVTDTPGGASDTGQGSVQVAEADSLTGSAAAAPHLVEGGALTGTLATFTDSNTAAPAGDFQATIDWGDGHTDTAAVQGGQGAFTVGGAHTYTEEGTFPLRITLADGDDDGSGLATATATVSTTVVVNDASLSARDLHGTALPLTTPEMAQLDDVTVANFTLPPASSPPLSYQAVIDWGDGSTDNVDLGPASGSVPVLGTHTYAEAGSYLLAVTVNGPDSLSATAYATVTDPTLTASMNSLSTTQGVPLGQSPDGSTDSDIQVASFTDPNRRDQTSTYDALIAWGDGQQSPGTISPAGSGTFTVWGDHTYADPGQFLAGVTLSDDGRSTVHQTAGVLVLPAGPVAAEATPLTVVEDTPLQQAAVATFPQPGPDAAYHARIDWGDGQSSDGLVQDGTVYGSHTYVQAGFDLLQVTVQDGQGHTVSAATTAHVTDPTLTATGRTLAAAQDVAVSDVLLATVTDPDPSDSAGEFAATILWGDGTSSGGTVLGGGGQFFVTGGHTYGHAGAFTATVLIRPEQGPPVVVTCAVQVAPVAEGGVAALTLATVADADPDGTASDYRVQVQWGDGSHSTASVTPGPGELFTAAGGHTWDEEGSYAVSATVRDQGGSTVMSGQTIVVAEAPLDGQGQDLDASEGQALTGVQVATFRDTDPAAADSSTAYAAQVCWGDGQFSSGTVQLLDDGSLAVLADHAYADAGPFQAVVVITHGSQVIAVPSTVTVSDPPLTPSDTQATGTPVDAVEGQPASDVTVTTFTDANPDRAATDYGATIDWGDGSAPSSGRVVPGGDGPFQVEGSHTYSDDGAYPITVTLSRPQTTLPLVVHTTATVTEAGVLLTTVPLSAVAGVPLGGPVASFTDPGARGATPSYQALVDWGDGSGPLPADVTPAGDGYAVTSRHTYAHPGTFHLSVQVLDDSVPAGAAGMDVPVASPAPVGSLLPLATPVAFTEGDDTPLTLLTFTDANTAQTPAAYRAVLDWGDGSPAEEGQVLGGGGSFQVVGSHSYARQGSYLLSVALSDATRSVLAWTTAVVDEQPVPFAVRTLTVAANQPLSDVPVADLSDPDPQQPARVYDAAIDWGDGTTSTGLVVGSGGSLHVVGSHTYANSLPGAQRGTDVYTLTVTLQEPDGAWLTASAPVTVVELSEGDTLSDRPLLWFHDANALANDPTDYSATVTWGDGSDPQPATVEMSGTQEFYVTTQDPSDPSVSGHVYAEERPSPLAPGPYPLTIQVTDDGGSSAESTPLLTVADRPLAGAGAPVALAGQAGQALSGVVVAQFQDSAPQGETADYTATIDWGDGSISTGAVQAAGGGDGSSSSWQVLGDHTYGQAGSFAISVLITDQGGSSLVTTASAAISGPDTAAPWALAAVPLRDDPSRLTLLPAGVAQLDPNLGAVRLQQALDFDQSPGTAVGGDPALLYNSADVSAHPVLEATLAGGDASALRVRLTWDGGTPGPWVSYDTTGHQPGEPYLFAVPVPEAVSHDGLYPWQLDVLALLPDGSTAAAAASGLAQVGAADYSPYGAGWGLASLSRLVFDPAGDVLRVFASGDSQRFTPQPDGSFQTPPEDFGTLAADPSDGGYVYTARDQTQWHYDAEGELTAVVDAHGLTTACTWTAGLLTQVTAPDGGQTTLAYDGAGQLASVTEPGHRLLTLSHDADGNLSGLLDAAGYPRTFTYDAGHHLVRDQWDPLDTAYRYDATGVLVGVDQGLGQTLTLAPAAFQGLPGGAPALRAFGKNELTYLRTSGRSPRRPSGGTPLGFP